MRIEHRVPGADANPYLSMAAALASGLYGIKHELSLKIDATIGNEYDNSNSNLFSNNLKDAVHKMKNSNIPIELFGAEFVDHFIRTREWEYEQFQESAREWEVKRYFEII